MSVNALAIDPVSTKYCPSLAGTLVSIVTAFIAAVVIGFTIVPAASLNISYEPLGAPVLEVNGF